MTNRISSFDRRITTGQQVLLAIAALGFIASMSYAVYNDWQASAEEQARRPLAVGDFVRVQERVIATEVWMPTLMDGEPTFVRGAVTGVETCEPANTVEILELRSNNALPFSF